MFANRLHITQWLCWLYVHAFSISAKAGHPEMFVAAMARKTNPWHIKLPAKLLDYFLRSNESDINQSCVPRFRMENALGPQYPEFTFDGCIWERVAPPWSRTNMHTSLSRAPLAQKASDWDKPQHWTFPEWTVPHECKTCTHWEYEEACCQYKYNNLPWKTSPETHRWLWSCATLWKNRSWIWQKTQST